MSSFSDCTLAEGVLSKIQEVSKLIKTKYNYYRWITSLNKDVFILRLWKPGTFKKTWKVKAFNVPGFKIMF